MTNNLCTETGYISLNHVGEQLCGDRVEIVDKENENILVLADGLGSGVKANILSTLTSKIISTMLAGGMPIEECIDTIASTLPVCKVRQVAYSTFTVIRILENRVAELIQFDNPAVIVLRNGTRYNYPVSTREVGGKQIHESRFEVMENDVLIAMSDGAPFAAWARSSTTAGSGTTSSTLPRPTTTRTTRPSTSPPTSSMSATASTRASRATIPPWPWCACARARASIWSSAAFGPEERHQDDEPLLCQGG